MTRVRPERLIEILAMQPNLSINAQSVAEIQALVMDIGDLRERLKSYERIVEAAQRWRGTIAHDDCGEPVEFDAARAEDALVIAIDTLNDNKNRRVSLEARIGRENVDAGAQPARFDIASLLVDERSRVFTPEGLALLAETNKKR